MKTLKVWIMAIVLILAVAVFVVPVVSARSAVQTPAPSQFGYVIAAVLLGILARTVLPFLLTLRDKPDTKFDRAFLVPAVVTVLIALITSPLVFATIPPDQLQNTAPTFADLMLLFVAAWGTTDVVREGQKLLAAKAAS